MSIQSANPKPGGAKWQDSQVIERGTDNRSDLQGFKANRTTSTHFREVIEMHGTGGPNNRAWTDQEFCTRSTASQTIIDTSQMVLKEHKGDIYETPIF